MYQCVALNLHLKGVCSSNFLRSTGFRRHCCQRDEVLVPGEEGSHCAFFAVLKTVSFLSLDEHSHGLFRTDTLHPSGTVGRDNDFRGLVEGIVDSVLVGAVLCRNTRKWEWRLTYLED
jgi:hypothetical protein